MNVSIYQTTKSLRVVLGAHSVAAEHKNLHPRVYSSTEEAYKIETDSAVRAAILRMDPDACNASTPAQRHHIVPGVKSLLVGALLAFGGFSAAHAAGFHGGGGGGGGGGLLIIGIIFVVVMLFAGSSDKTS